jgi:hypothetical protein
MLSNFCHGLSAVAIVGTVSPAFANVIIDWDEKPLPPSRQWRP